MKTFYLVIFEFLFSFQSKAQYFTFPTSGNAANSQLTAPDGVTLVPSIRSTGCAPGSGSNFTYSASHVSTGAIYRNTSWAAGCKNSTDIIKLDFSTTQFRPLGIKFSIYDVDNGSDSVSVLIYSKGSTVAYTYSLYSPTYVTANGASPSHGFCGSGSNNSVQDDNTGKIDITTTSTVIQIDSILVFKYNNRDVTGNPSQSFAGFQWNNTANLPIKLVSFVANKSEEGYQFNWKVAEESSTESYQIEYSLNGSNFSELGDMIQAKGTSYGQAEYSIIRNKIPAAEIIYFRLVSNDINGKKHFSKTIKIFNDRLTTSQIYPTKFNNSVSLSAYSTKNCSGVIKLIGLDGKVVYHKNVGLAKGQNLIPVEITSAIAKGMYLFVGEFDNEITFRHKLIKE